MVIHGILLLVVTGRCLGQLHPGQEPDRAGRLPPEKTDRPVIGILSMELSPTIRKYVDVGDHDSYIAASYVKFVEGAGARVTPILIGQPPEYYQEVVSKVNGLLFPGGSTYFTEKNGFAEAGKQLYRRAKEVNQGGAHFPVLGICLGMELLAVADAGHDFRGYCKSEDPLPLKFLPESKRDSQLFARAPPAVIRTLEKQNVTINHHGRCITQDHMREWAGDWRTLTVNDDADGLEFVSVLEHRRLPFYGLQFHPEKNIYEWKRTKNYPHSELGVAAARYFADFLVSEARRNSHSFSEDEEKDRLIYRHQSVYTRGRLMWEQLYLFSSSQGGEGASSGTLAPASAQHEVAAGASSGRDWTGGGDVDFDV